MLMRRGPTKACELDDEVQPAFVVRRSKTQVVWCTAGPSSAASQAEGPEMDSEESNKKKQVVMDLCDDRLLVGLDFGGIRAFPYAERPIGSKQLALLQCVLTRSSSVYGDRELTLESCATGQKLLVARRRARSGNYHIFDVSRGTVGAKLKKKSGNYVGKVANHNFIGQHDAPPHRLLLDNNANKKCELALYMHRRTKTLAALVDGAKPRQICVALPSNDDDDSDKANLLDRYFKNDSSLIILNQRQPKLIDGQYSLNFHGRATIPSVKNCQLVDSANNTPDDVALQLGKVKQDTFNLDFKRPFTPLTAFGLAICQFMR